MSRNASVTSKSGKRCQHCGKTHDKKGKYCSTKCRVAAFRAGTNKITRSPETLEAKAQEPKQDKRTSGLIPATPGDVLNPKGRQPKKLITDSFRQWADEPWPAQLYVNGLEPFAGKKLTFAQVVTLRAFLNAGLSNRGVKDLSEIAARLDGKVPLPVTPKEPEREFGFSGLTMEEKRERLRELLRDIEAALPEFTGRPN